MKLCKFIIIFSVVLLFAGFAFAQTEREQGIELYNQGDYQGAIESLQKTVETDKKDREAWLFLGMSFAKIKKEGQAVKSFKKADKYSVKEPQVNDTNVKIISKPRATYTDSARQNLITGEIKLAVEFGADGEIKFVFPFQILPDGLTENAIKAALKIKFEPATKNGKPISTIGIIKNAFSIY